jgi:tripartite-type tricarboxylate transporter receptor subunit TctC
MRVTVRACDSVKAKDARSARRAQGIQDVLRAGSPEILLCYRPGVAGVGGFHETAGVPACDARAVELSPALGQESVAQFYKGKQITVIVGSSPGGGYDIYARLLARHMGKYIPGNPSLVVSNMPGAASNTSVAHVYNVAPKDGTVIGAPQNSAIMDALFDNLLGNARGLRHDATKLIHIGSATTDHYVCIARSDAPVKTFKDALSQELLIGASQPGTSTRDFPAMLNNLTGAKIRQVSGYPGTREITLAIEKNEVQGLCGFSWSSFKAQRLDWINSGFIRVIVQEHDKGNPEINKMGVPLAVDFATSPENRKIMELVYSSETFGRPYMLAPGVPADRVATLRKAFLETMKDANCSPTRSASGSPSIRSRARTCRRWRPAYLRRRSRSSRRPSKRWNIRRRKIRIAHMAESGFSTLQIPRAPLHGKLPYLVPVGVEHQGGIGRRDEPGVGRKLSLELTWPPARVAESEQGLAGTSARGHVAENVAACGHRHRGADRNCLRPAILGAVQHEAKLGLHRAAKEDPHPPAHFGGAFAKRLEKLGEWPLPHRPVDDQTHRAVLVVAHHQDDGARKTRIPHRG